MKKIIDRLQHLIKQDEYPEVIECTQILVSEILAEQVETKERNRDRLFCFVSLLQPSISVNEIIDRVIEILSTPPKSEPPILCNPCSPSQVPLNTKLSTAGPLNNCQSNVFEKLFQLEVDFHLYFHLFQSNAC